MCCINKSPLQLSCRELFFDGIYCGAMASSVSWTHHDVPVVKPSSPYSPPHLGSAAYQTHICGCGERIMILSLFFTSYCLCHLLFNLKVLEFLPTCLPVIALMCFICALCCFAPPHTHTSTPKYFPLSFFRSLWFVLPCLNLVSLSL